MGNGYGQIRNSRYSLCQKSQSFLESAARNAIHGRVHTDSFPAVPYWTLRSDRGFQILRDPILLGCGGGLNPVSGTAYYIMLVVFFTCLFVLHTTHPGG